MTRMLYLHGFASSVGKVGGTKDYVAKMNLTDEMIAFDAPFEAAGGESDGARFKWFTLPEEGIEGADAFGEMKQSADYIAEKIRGADIDIVAGASQGGFMALYLTLNNFVRPRRTVAMVPFYLPQLVEEGGGAGMNRETPILWIAGGRDERIPAGVGGVWRDLEAAGANLEYYLDPESAHSPDTWTPGFFDKITKWCEK